MRGRAQRLPHNANQVSTAFGKTQGCVVLVAGLLVAWWATNAQSKYRQHLGKTFGCLVCLLLVGYRPFFFTLLPLVGVENTYSDGWIMDRDKYITFLVCWLLGLLAVIACVIQCLMDMQFFCLCAWLVDGWMDGWMDGCCVDKGGTVCGGGRSAFSQCKPSIDSIWGKQGCVVWVAWFVGCLLV